MRKKREAPLGTLNSYLPAGAYDTVMQYLQHYKVHLTITKERRSVLGDYRFAVHGKNHRISVNGNLNSFAFLITLLHELAHGSWYMGKFCSNFYYLIFSRRIFRMK